MSKGALDKYIYCYVLYTVQYSKKILDIAGAPLLKKLELPDGGGGGSVLDRCYQ